MTSDLWGSTRWWKEKKLQANDVAHVQPGYAFNSAVLRPGEAKVGDTFGGAEERYRGGEGSVLCSGLGYKMHLSWTYGCRFRGYLETTVP